MHMLQNQLFAGAALDLTTGVHRVFLFGAILSGLMALLSFAGIKNKKKLIKKYEHIVKHNKRVFEEKTKHHLHNVQIILQNMGI